MAKPRRFTAEFKTKVVLEALNGESSEAELCQCHHLSEDQLSKWNHQIVENAAFLFESRDKASEDAAEPIVHLEQLVGRLTLALDIEKSLGETPKQKHVVELNPSEKRVWHSVLRGPGLGTF